jgi:hypothetical protein
MYLLEKSQQVYSNPEVFLAGEFKRFLVPPFSCFWSHGLLMWVGNEHKEKKKQAHQLGRIDASGKAISAGNGHAGHAS